MLTDDRDNYDMGGDVGIAIIPAQPQLVSDEDMEEDHTDFILDEALSEEEQDMLMSKLEQDND